MVAALNRVLGCLVVAAALSCGGGGKAPVDCATAGADCTLRQAAEQAGVQIGSAVRDVFDDDPRYGLARRASDQPACGRASRT